MNRAFSPDNEGKTPYEHRQERPISIDRNVFAAVFDQPYSALQRREIDRIFDPRQEPQPREVWEMALTELTERFSLPLKPGDIDRLSRIYAGVYEERQESTAAHSLSLALLIADMYRGLPDSPAYQERRNQQIMLALVHEIDEVFGESKTETSMATTPGAVLAAGGNRSAESIFDEVMQETTQQGMQQRGFTEADYTPLETVRQLWAHSDLTDDPARGVVDTRRIAFEFKTYDKILGNQTLNANGLSPDALKARQQPSKTVTRDGQDVVIPYVPIGDQGNGESSKMPYLALLPYWRLLEQDRDTDSLPLLKRLGRRTAADAGIFMHRLPHVVDETAFVSVIRQL